MSASGLTPEEISERWNFGLWGPPGFPALNSDDRFPTKAEVPSG
jgi:hypothetical protein